VEGKNKTKDIVQQAGEGNKIKTKETPCTMSSACNSHARQHGRAQEGYFRSGPSPRS